MARRHLGPKVERHALGALTLWRDDLELMIDALGEVTTEIRIEVDGYELDSIEDLADWEGLDLYDFYANAGDGQIELTLNEQEAVITVRDGDLRARGVVGTIVEYAGERQRGLRLRPQTGFGWTIFIGVSLALLGLAEAIAGRIVTHRWNFNGGNPIWLTLATGFMYGGLLVWVLWDHPPGATMYSASRSEAPPWLERNKDALVTNAIVSAVFLVVGIIVGYLLPK